MSSFVAFVFGAVGAVLFWMAVVGGTHLALTVVFPRAAVPPPLRQLLPCYQIGEPAIHWEPFGEPAQGQGFSIQAALGYEVVVWREECLA